MNRWIAVVAAAMCLSAGCATRPPATDLRQEVTDSERAFAQTMARRDFQAFTEFLAEDTVFFAEDRALRGKAEVAAAWKAFFDAPTAPFSWEPTVVEVLEAGTLALSSGPVRNPQGKVVATFNSIWQRQDGRWKVIFDKGSRACP